MREYEKPMLFIVEFEMKDMITLSSPIVTEGIEDGGEAATE